VILPAVGAGLLRQRDDQKQMMSWVDGDDQPEQEEPIESTGGHLYNAPTICGLDQRPFFPATLVFMLVWSLCMMPYQEEVLIAWFGSCDNFRHLSALLYVVTLGCLAYLSFCDPGLMDKETFGKWQAGQIPLPQRARKHWLYKRPVLRFDHYCRWTTGVIGLYNHRQFIVFVGGLVACSLLDLVTDVLCLLHYIWEGSLSAQLLVCGHLVASAFCCWYTMPLLRQHTGFICRNELANDWKDDKYSVVRDRSGKKISVHDLDDEEFDEREDEFEYDPERNPWDKGLQQNLITFWTRMRSPAHKCNLGDF